MLLNGGMIMAIAKIRLYSPHSGQIPLHKSKARFRIVSCGRRWGKTFACINEIVKFAWENPGVMTWWVAPVYRQSRIPFRIISKKFEGAIQAATKSPMEIQWLNGSITQFLSADQPDNLRGEGVHFLVVDEAAMIPEETWYEVLRPTLSDKQGKAIIVSTPKGQNWFYHVWARGEDPAFPEYASFRFPTSSNPFIPASEIEEVKSTLPSDVFRQEYLAEFLEDSAGVFRGIKDCIQGELEEPKPGGEYIVAWDIAKNQDFSVLLCMERQRKHVVAFDRFNQIEYQHQLNRLENMARKYRASIIMDSTGVGDPLFEEVRRRGMVVQGFKFTGESKQQLIENLQVMIEQQKISFPDIPVLINELQSFQYEMTRAGNIRYSAPEGYHDDCVIALALAAWACRHRIDPQIRVV